jgi:hypothetical protein
VDIKKSITGCGTPTALLHDVELIIKTQNNNMKHTILKSLVVAAMVVAPGLLADQVKTISGYGPYQTGQGGEFTLQVIGSGSPDLNPYLGYYAAGAINQVSGALNQPSFQTFCVEGGENIYANSTYDISLGSSTVFSGTPLSAGAAFLYYEFAKGTLVGYDYATTVAARKADADKLQRAIWWLMGQEAQTYTASNPYMLLAVTTFGSQAAALAANSSLATPISVSVLSLWVPGQVGNPAGKRQDQLILTGDQGYNTPDGGMTIAFLGMAMTGLAALRRRIA